MVSLLRFPDIRHTPLTKRTLYSLRGRCASSLIFDPTALEDARQPPPL